MSLTLILISGAYLGTKFLDKDITSDGEALAYWILATLLGAVCLISDAINLALWVRTP